MKEIYTEIEINASPAKVWEVLTDFKKYPSWNPFILSISGTLKKDSEMDMMLKIYKHKETEFKPVVIKCEPEKEIRWFGKKALGGMGLIEGEQVFHLKKINEFKTKFIHTEFFKGLFLPMIWGSISYDTQIAFENMNAALKKRCEHLA